MIESVGPFRYRLAGSIDVRDWADAFGIRPAELRASTLSDFVATLLGKSPRRGDSTLLNNVRLTVEKTRRNRIETVILSIEPLGCGWQQSCASVAVR